MKTIKQKRRTPTQIAKKLKAIHRVKDKGHKLFKRGYKLEGDKILKPNGQIWKSVEDFLNA